MTQDLAETARARRLRALETLTGPRRARPCRGLFDRFHSRLLLAA